MKFNTLKSYSKVLKVIDIESCEEKTIDGIKITLYNNLTNGSMNITNYVFEKDGKKLVYACCNAKSFRDF